GSLRYSRLETCATPKALLAHRPLTDRTTLSVIATCEAFGLRQSSAAFASLHSKSTTCRGRMRLFGITIRSFCKARFEGASKQQVRKSERCRTNEPTHYKVRRERPGGRIMPKGSHDNIDQCHRQHKFPGEIHQLISAQARKRAAEPNKERN